MLLDVIEVDTPISPGAKGTGLFLRGITDELRQQYRQGLFAVERDDIVAVATK